MGNNLFLLLLARKRPPPERVFYVFMKKIDFSFLETILNERSCDSGYPIPNPVFWKIIGLTLSVLIPDEK